MCHGCRSTHDVRSVTFLVLLLDGGPVDLDRGSGVSERCGKASACRCAEAVLILSVDICLVAGFSLTFIHMLPAKSAITSNRSYHLSLDL